ncbi:hypothetical protein H920_00357 [Fukomys damarensis]|uniref:Uncharacterized protein n=1 Tax=Fukomys damarensis TaxID=885580 RepID=A0A091E1M4_FUKDA|nr:hypothetical protein H920_00357 [Fukomys damarensis]
MPFLENKDCVFLEQKRQPAVNPEKVADTISGPEMVSDFDSLNKSVTLAESQSRSSGCSKLEDASRAQH